MEELKSKRFLFLIIFSLVSSVLAKQVYLHWSQTDYEVYEVQPEKKRRNGKQSKKTARNATSVQVQPHFQEETKSTGLPVEEEEYHEDFAQEIYSEVIVGDENEYLV